jgi:hypothetical protein
VGGGDTENSDEAFIGRSVVVFSDDDFFSEVKDNLSDSTSKVSKKSNLEEIKSGEVAVIDESWIYTNEQKQIDKGIETALKNNIPMIFVGNDLYLYKKSSLDVGAMAYTGSENIYCIYNKGINFIHSIENSDEKEAMQWAYQWADTVLSEDPEEILNDSEPMPRPLSALAGNSQYWERILYKTSTMNCAPHGNYSVSATVYRLRGFDDGFKYFAVQYSQEAVPNNNYRLADIYLKGDQQSYLTEHGPNTTNGTKTTSASVSLGIGNAGVSAGFSIGWSYSISDVVLINQSQRSTKVDFWHNVDETKAVGLGYTAEPGLTYRVPNSTLNTNNTLTHEVQFCKPVIKNVFMQQGLSFYFYPILEMQDFKKYTMKWSFGIPLN